MTDSLAVNLLLTLDGRTRERCAALNATLRAGYPPGFKLDETHEPHITLLHRFLRRADLEAALASAGQAIADRDLGSIALRAVAVEAAPFGTPAGTALLSVVVEPLPAMVGLQAAVVRAFESYDQPNGTSAAFVTTVDEPEVNAATIDYVQSFVRERTGERYEPHITVGIASDRTVEPLKHDFEPFDANACAIAAYQLGNFGTARQLIRSWALPSAAS